MRISIWMSLYSPFKLSRTPGMWTRGLASRYCQLTFSNSQLFSQQRVRSIPPSPSYQLWLHPRPLPSAILSRMTSTAVIQMNWTVMLHGPIIFPVWMFQLIKHVPEPLFVIALLLVMRSVLRWYRGMASPPVSFNCLIHSSLLKYNQLCVFVFALSPPHSGSTYWCPYHWASLPYFWPQFTSKFRWCRDRNGHLNLASIIPLWLLSIHSLKWVEKCEGLCNILWVQRMCWVRRRFCLAGITKLWERVAKIQSLNSKILYTSCHK